VDAVHDGENPGKQDILQQEIVLGDTTLATPSNLAQMPYLKACVRETLQLSPFIAVPREPVEDLKLGGYLIPRRTAQDEDEVFEFKPERWLHKKDFVLTETADAFSSIPFGF